MVHEKKKEAVELLKKELDSWPVVGLLDMNKLPAAQLQHIRFSLKNARIIMTKKSVIKFALEKATKKDIKNLMLLGPKEPALILSKDDPFKLQKILNDNKSEAFARAGDIAPFDLIIPAGKTNLPPGPAISELQKAGLKAAIKGPNIEILESKLVAKEGEKISEQTAGLLIKLNVKPMEIGLNMLGAWSDGLIYKQDILSVDEKTYIKNIQSAWTNAFNLAFNADWPTKDTVPFKITDAARNAFNLAVNAEIYNKESIGIFIQRAQAEALSLKGLVPS